MHSYFRFSCIKAFLVFVLLSIFSSNIFAFYNVTKATPTGLVNFYSPEYSWKFPSYVPASLLNNDCWGSSNESCYICPNGSKTFIVSGGSAYIGRCFSCPPDTDYYIRGVKVPPLTGHFTEWSCGPPPKCPEGFELKENSPYFNGASTCAKPVPCGKGFEWDSNTLRCELIPCPSGSYRSDDSLACIPLPECTINEKLFYDGIYKCVPIECAVDEYLENGQCIKKPVCDSESKFYTLCQWYEDWKIWRDDYNWYESEKHEDNNSIKYTLDDIQQQDKTFYDEIRLKLENGELSFGEYPIVQFPAFCEWSTVVCEWYLDYKDFTQEIRDFMDEYNENIDENENPLEVEEQPYDIKENNNVDLTTTRYIQGSSTCPINRDIPVSMGGHTINIVISYRSLCDAAVMFKPFVILMSFIAGMMIITNTGRRAETGD